MLTSTETAVAYIPRVRTVLDENEISKPSQSVEDVENVKDVTVDVQQLVDVSPKTGLSTRTRILIAAAVVIVIAIAVTLGIIFGIKNTTTTTTTTTKTTVSVTTTSTTTTTAMAAPTNLVSYRGNNNQTYTFLLTGSVSGSIWGTTIYTDDSNLATAAVHAGFVSNGQTTVVTVMILPGQNSYTSSTQNGITSSSYGSWFGSYSVIGVIG